MNKLIESTEFTRIDHDFSWWYRHSGRLFRFHIVHFLLCNNGGVDYFEVYNERCSPPNKGTALSFINIDSTAFHLTTMNACQVPIIIPVIVMLVSAYLVIGPIASDPQIQYLYALAFILAGLVFYVPFVYYKKVFPGMGKFQNYQL